MHLHQGEVEGLALGGQAEPVDLTGPANQAVVEVVADEAVVDLGHRVAGVGGQCLSGDAASDFHSFGRGRQTDARIPAGVLGQPGQRFGTHSLHRGLWQQFVVLHPVVTDPAVGEDDVGVEDFTGQWIHPAGANRGADVVVEPADEVPPHILGVLLDVSAGAGVLEFDLDRVGDPDVLERLVPVEHTLFHPAAITHRRGVLDVERDRVLWWTDLQ